MANSLIDFSVVNPEASGSFLKGFQGAQERQQALAQQQRQNALADLQLRSAQRGEEEALAEREAYKNQDPLTALRAAGLNKQALAYEKQQQERQAASIKQAEEEIKIGRGIAERAFAAGRAASMSAPGTEKAAVLSVLNQYQGKGIDLSQDLSEVANLPDAQVLEHVFNKSQELKNLSEMIATDTGSAVIRTPRFQQPGMPAAQPIPATASMPAGIPGQTQGGRIAGANALTLPAPGGAMPAGQPQAVPGGGVMYPKSMTPAQQATEARARAQMAQSERHFEATPTLTQIVDPTDPNKMLSIDARRYQGGGVGSPGVIGVSGKEPGAALRQNKVEAGKTQLADDLDNLRASFQKLDQMRAIPSTERGGVSNIGSATAASGMGQMLGRAVGTEAQVERDVINSARMRLVNSIKNATGMSAQQLNSNVELQSMLKSISDPGQSVQAALRIIDDIENAYVKGAGKLPKRGESAAPAAGGAGRREIAPGVFVTERQ